jgi:glucosamine kinase
MIAIVDSGSTKSSWFIGEKERPKEGSFLDLPGVNPFQDDSGKINKELREGLKGVPLKKVTELYFYGAGCSDDYRCKGVVASLEPLFPNARIEVTHDLLAAAHSLCRDQAGIAAILGTGSNSCVYNGEKIIRNRMNLGPLLGDEGSGMQLGKKLLTAYFYDQLPADLQQHFQKQYSEGKRKLFNQLYDHPKPHVLMASFTPFLRQFPSHPFALKLIGGAFQEFIEKHLLPYPESSHLPIHFTGSIAYFFKDILVTSLKKNELKVGKIVQRPLPGLVEYHRSRRTMGHGPR